MQTVELLVEAFKRGAAWRPGAEYANLHNLDESRVRKMDGSEPDAQLLVRSLQYSDIQYDWLVALFHKGRKPDYDGGIGKATESLVEIPRCPIPDFAPPLGARFHYDDPELQKIVESMQEAANAGAGITGPYWRGCNPEKPDIHSLVIGIDARQAPSVFLNNMDKILGARKACAAQIGVDVKFVINPTSMDGLQQYQVYRSIPGGVIGMNYFPSSNSCGRISNGSMDSTYNPSNWVLHANLGTHESEGHGFGFNHTRGGIMNPSIVLVDPLSWIGDTAWSQVIRYYPGKPLVTDPGIPVGDVLIDALEMSSPLIIRANGQIVMNGPLLAKAKGQLVKKLNVVRWPGA